MSDRPGVNWEANVYTRVYHVPRHGVRLRRNPLRALRSLTREVGNFLWGAFTPIREAY